MQAREARTQLRSERALAHGFVAFGVLVAVGACNPPGLTLEVVIDDPAIAKVELFAGRDCGPCPIVTAPPMLPLMAVDAGYFVDDPVPFTVANKDFSDGLAGFRIEADQDETLAILVALAYDGQGTIVGSWTGHDVHIPDASAAHWQIHLAPTTPIDPARTIEPAGTEHAAVWPNPSGHPACVLVEHWNGGARPTHEMLSPVDDYDCDAVAAANECAQFIPNAVGALPTLDTANCVTPVQSGVGGAAICMVGGPQCTEMPGPSNNTCVALETPYCTPLTICQCSTRPDALACIRDLVVTGTTDAPTMPYMKCSIGVDQNGSRCDTNPLSVDAGPFLGTSATGCKDLQLADADPPLGSFGNALHVGTSAKIHFDTFTAPCKVSVTWEGTQTAPHVEYGFFDAELDNGYHLLVPAKVEVHVGCVNPSMCGVVTTNNASETIFQCVNQASVVPACGPDTSHGCAGPWCNGVCCGYGEQCTSMGCSCAGGAACSGTNRCETGVPNEDNCGSLCCGPAPGPLCPF